MIVDLILDRRDNDEEMTNGYTHKNGWDGAIVDLKYKASCFYDDVAKHITGHGDYFAKKIIEAMDRGIEDDVKAALCEYLIKCHYSDDICNYVNSVQWLE